MTLDPIFVLIMFVTGTFIFIWLWLTNEMAIEDQQYEDQKIDFKELEPDDEAVA